VVSAINIHSRDHIQQLRPFLGSAKAAHSGSP